MIRTEGFKEPVGMGEGKAIVRTNAVDESAGQAEQHKNQEPMAKPTWGDAERRQLDFAVESVNKALETEQRGLQFSVHEETSRIMVKVVDRNNNDEVIRELPPEKVLDMVAQLRKMIGVLIDERG